MSIAPFLHLNISDLGSWDPSPEPKSIPLNIIKEANKMTQQTQPQEFQKQLGRAEIRRADRAIKKKALETLVKEHNLQFAYVREGGEYYTPEPKGGMVIAYKVPENGGTIVEVSTALCSKHDVFDKLEGKVLAASNFAEGKRVKVKVSKDRKYGQDLAFMFGCM